MEKKLVLHICSTKLKSAGEALNGLRQGFSQKKAGQGAPNYRATRSASYFDLVHLIRYSAVENGLGGPLSRAGLDLLDAWSDGNATRHDR